MRVLLTGGTGFLGTWLVERLSRSHEIVCLVRPGRKVPAGVAAVEMDLAKGVRRIQLPAQIDCVIHLAQSAHYQEFPTRADDIHAINVAATVALAEYAIAAGAGMFLFTSSGNVHEPYDGRLAEDAPLHPASYYGSTKAAAELMLASFAPYMTCCAARLWFLYGPGQTNRLMPRLIANISEGRPVLLQGRGDGLRLAPTFVDDAAEALVAAIEQRWSGVYNVASPHVASLRTISDCIGRMVGRKPVFKRLPGRAPHPLVPVLAKLEKTYGLERFRMLEEGLHETIASASLRPARRT